MCDNSATKWSVGCSGFDVECIDTNTGFWCQWPYVKEKLALNSCIEIKYVLCYLEYS